MLVFRVSLLADKRKSPGLMKCVVTHYCSNGLAHRSFAWVDQGSSHRRPEHADQVPTLLVARLRPYPLST